MQIKLLISAGTIALVAGLGTASADDVFATLEGVSATAMSQDAKHAIRGGGGPPSFFFFLDVCSQCNPGMSPLPTFESLTPLLDTGGGQWGQ